MEMRLKIACRDNTATTGVSWFRMGIVVQWQEYGRIATCMTIQIREHLPLHQRCMYSGDSPRSFGIAGEFSGFLVGSLSENDTNSIQFV